jgi:phage baseplate assembly protein W
MARADRNSITAKTPEYYSDFLANFDRNPVTGLLARATNEESVKLALKNLVLTQLSERPYQPTVGSKVNSVLFDPIDNVTEKLLSDTIRSCINNNEPRVNLVDVVVESHPNRNEYRVSIYFNLKNIPDKTVAFSFILNRVR